MLQLRLGLIVALAPTAIAHAADCHVLRDVDADGNADPCPVVGHQTHYSTDTTACAATFDIDNDAVAETLYCDIQAALNACNASGDTVEIHGDATWVWDETDTTEEEISFYCNLGESSSCHIGGTCTDADFFGVIKPCAGCTAEGDRRFVRGALMLGVQDTARLDPVGATAIEGIFGLCQASGENCAFVTISHFQIDDANHSEATCDASDANYVGLIGLKGDADNLRVSNVTANVASWDTAAECAGFSNEAGIAFVASIASGNNDIDNVEIDNNTVDLCATIGVKRNTSGENAACTTGSGCYGEWAIHDNAWTCNGDAGSGLVNCGEYKGFEDLAYYNNTHDGPGNSLKTRNCNGSFWQFNNVWDGVDSGWDAAWWTYQGNSSGGWTNARNFNNTVRDLPGVNRTWPNAEHEGFYNNTELGASGATHEMVDGIDSTDNFGNNHWDDAAGGGATANFTSAYDSTGDEGGHVCDDATPATCGSNTLASDCSDNVTTGCDASSVGTAATFPFKIQAGSSLIDAGTDDPLGQGAGQCSIMLSWKTIDCTLDRDGEDRNTCGAAWDIGADEFDTDCAGGGPGPRRVIVVTENRNGDVDAWP